MIQEDKDIIQALSSGDKVAINRTIHLIYENYHAMIKRLVMHNSGTSEEADDIFQETLVIFYRNIQDDKFQGKSSIKTYLYVVARNLWYQKIRKSRKVNFVDIEVLPDNSHPTDKLIEQEEQPFLHRKLKHMLTEISSSCRELLTDFYYAEMTLDTIRDKYKLASKQVAKTKKYRCLKKLIEKFHGKTVESAPI